MEKTLLAMQVIGFIAFGLEILTIALGSLLSCRTFSYLLVVCMSALTLAFHVPILFMQHCLAQSPILTLVLMAISFIVIIVAFFMIKAYDKKDEE